MIQNSIEENKRLIEKYPWLLPRNSWTGKVVKDYDYTWTELDDVPDGWRIAFGDMLCEDIQSELEKINFVDKYRITQIKEKFGGLHWYDEGVPVGCKVHDIIEDYSHLSEYICIACGELDVPSTDGWITPICKECIKKTSIKDPESYWDEIDRKQAPHTLPLQRRYRIWRKDSGDSEVITVDMSDTVRRIRKKYSERKGK